MLVSFPHFLQCDFFLHVMQPHKLIPSTPMMANKMSKVEIHPPMITGDGVVPL